MSEQSLWFIPSLDWLRAPRLEMDVDYRRAVDWARDFTPESDKESYSVAYEHAKRKYDQIVVHFDALDRKADDLLKAAMTIAALLVAAVKAFDVTVTPWLVCAFLAFLVTILISAITRRPTPQAMPGSVDEVLDFVEDFRIHDRHQMEALVAASLWCAIVGTRLVIHWKAIQISRATVIFVAGVSLLFSAFL